MSDRSMGYFVSASPLTQRPLVCIQLPHRTSSLDDPTRSLARRFHISAPHLLSTIESPQPPTNPLAELASSTPTLLTSVSSRQPTCTAQGYRPVDRSAVVQCRCSLLNLRSRDLTLNDICNVSADSSPLPLPLWSVSNPLTPLNIHPITHRLSNLKAVSMVFASPHRCAHVPHLTPPRSRSLSNRFADAVLQRGLASAPHRHIHPSPSSCARTRVHSVVLSPASRLEKGASVPFYGLALSTIPAACGSSRLFHLAPPRRRVYRENSPPHLTSFDSTLCPPVSFRLIHLNLPT
ncbi:hypothetical protein R3P38DRAFT_3283435 [Favolaschia claudopus]|uniref:Uncharacterized protein n=1 Tax=Favolaschia claudopus TaxID=2862362 RepID=A0AAW0A8F1_9AGAR